MKERKKERKKVRKKERKNERETKVEVEREREGKGIINKNSENYKNHKIISPK